MHLTRTRISWIYSNCQHECYAPMCRRVFASSTDLFLQVRTWVINWLRELWYVLKNSREGRNKLFRNHPFSVTCQELGNVYRMEVQMMHISNPPSNFNDTLWFHKIAFRNLQPTGISVASTVALVQGHDYCVKSVARSREIFYGYSTNYYSFITKSDKTPTIVP